MLAYTYIGIQYRQDQLADDPDWIRSRVKLMQETLTPCIDRVLQYLLQYLRQAIFAKTLIRERETETLDEFFWLQWIDRGVLVGRT